MNRGFPVAEYKARVSRAQALMAEHDLDALLLNGEPEVRYFTGFLTGFWESPTRPWFLIVPSGGDPVAVIPAIGAALMGKTWIADIRTWTAPDLDDDGVTLLAAVLRETGPRIGVPSGIETHLRMPLESLARVREAIAPAQIVPDADILRTLRMVKSAAEIAKIETACGIAGRAFSRVGDIAAPGVSLAQVFRRFQMLALEEGADWVPYLAGGAGRLGHGVGMQLTEGLSFIAADDTVLAPGMVVTLEPSAPVPGGGLLVHDDNYVITADGARKISPMADLKALAP